MHEGYERHELLRTINRFGIGLALLVVLRFVVIDLPMVRDLGFIVLPFSRPYGISLSWAMIFDIAVRSWIIYLILTFGARMRELIPQVFSEIPQMGMMAYLAAIFAVTLIVYFAYDDLIVPVLGRIAWVYSLACALVAVGSLSGLGVLVYQNSDQLLGLTRKRRVQRMASPSATSQAEMKYCPSCGSLLTLGGRFCSNCGSQLHVHSATEMSTTTEVPTPPIVENRAEKAKPAQSSVVAPRNQPEDLLKCTQCGTPLKSFSRFCRKCGAPSGT